MHIGRFAGVQADKSALVHNLSPGANDEPLDGLLGENLS